MKTANATRTWITDRELSAVNACGGIRNPAAIPALIEAARQLTTEFIDERNRFPRLYAALAALDAEPVA